MKIDLKGMEEVRDRVRSEAYVIDEIATELGQEAYDRIHPHIKNLYDFIKEITSGEWEVRSNEDAFD